jgi:hypothetical protein
MKQTIIGVLLGATITILIMEFVRPQNTLTMPPKSGIIVIPEQQNIVPGEFFNLFIVPVQEITPRWFDAITVKAEPEIQAEMHSATSLYSVCSLMAPLADSFQNGSQIDLEVLVESDGNVDGIEAKTRQPVKMILKTEGDSVYWRLKM